MDGGSDSELDGAKCAQRQPDSDEIRAYNKVYAAVHVADFLYKMFLRHGCPQDIVSGQGREFCNQLVNLLEELTGFKHRVSSAYHPQANERMNQTLKFQLQKLVNDQMDDRDYYTINQSKWGVLNILE